MVDVHFMLPDFSPVASNFSKKFHRAEFLSIPTQDPELAIHEHNHTLYKKNDAKRRRDDRAMCMWARRTHDGQKTADGRENAPNLEARDAHLGP